MQKVKRGDKWTTELLKPEIARLKNAASVLSDLADIEPTCVATRDGLLSVIKCINADGVYSEAVPDAEKTDAK